MVAQTSTKVRQAVDLLYELSADEEVRAEYDRQQKAQLDYNSIMEERFQDGREEQALAIARKLKAINMPLGQIVQITGLTEPQIRDL